MSEADELSEFDTDLREESRAASDADKLIRLQADFENFRRRNATVRAEAAKDVRREILGGLLGVYDNFLRAREHAATAPPEVAPYMEGFDAIRTQIEQFLKAQGLEEIPAEPGELFDPEVHEAAGTVASPDEASEGTIAETVRKGYAHKGKVVRPAMVVVHQTH